MIQRAVERATRESEELNMEIIRHVRQSASLLHARETLFALLLTTAGAGMAQAAGEELLIGELAGRVDAVEDSTSLADARWSNLPPREAIQYFRAKLPMTRAEWDGLEDAYKARGFTVTGLKMRYQLERTHQMLSDALERGLSRQQVVEQLGEHFGKWGVSATGRHHLETVFDTNVLGAYAAGRFAQMSRPETLKVRPYWQYRTAGDDSVRPTHAAMNGRVMPASSPIWDEWYPPNGYRCRCQVFSLSQGDVDTKGLQVETELPRQIEVGTEVHELLPDRGFSSSPRVQARAHRAVARMRKQVRRQGGLRAPQLTRLEAPEPGRRAPIYQSAGDLLRTEDAMRNAKVDRLAGLAPDDVEQLGRGHTFFNVFPQGQLGTVPRAERWVEATVYSQNLDTAEQLVRRLAAEPRMGHLAQRLQVTVRASYGQYDPGRWPDPEVAYDLAMTRRLGLQDATFVRSSELVLRVICRTDDELQAARRVALELGKGAAIPVRRAWEVPDVRVRGAQLAAGEGYAPAVLNRRRQGKGEQTVLSLTPMKGWRAEPVLVHEQLVDMLPDGG